MAATGRVGSMFGQLGQQWSFEQLGQQWTEATGNLQRAIQESTAAKQIQETTTRPCSVCQERFLRTNVFACVECKQLTCGGCFTRIHLFNPTGECTLSSPGKLIHVCRTCGPTVQERVRKENVQERMKRAHDFIDDSLEPYSYSAESKLEQSFRLGTKVIESVQQVAGFLPLGDAAKAINAGAYIVRYGPLVVFGNDIAMALQLLVTLAKRLQVPAVARSVPQDLFGGLYYMMGEHCGERGKAPELESLEHVDSRGSVPVPSQDLLLQLRRLVRLLYVATYSEPTPTDVQRLLRQVLPGSQLLLAELSDSHEVPSYFLTCTMPDRQAYLVLPGTRHPADVVTDVNAEAEEVPGGLAHRGMVRSAYWLMGEVAPVLKFLFKKGYTITLVGHSLGAAVAALFTLLLRPEIRTLKSFCYGTPACVDEQLMGSLVDCVVSVVNRDDVVPRLTVQSIQALAHSALFPGQRAKTKAWMDEDWKALKDVERLIEYRRRGGAQARTQEGAALEDASGTSTGGAYASPWKVARLLAAGVSRDAAVRALQSESGNLNRALLRATEEEVASPEQVQEQEQPPKPMAAEPEAKKAPKTWGFMGSDQAWGGLQRLGTMASAALSSSSSNSKGLEGVQDQQQEDLPPQFFIPGQVVHLYRQNGLSRAALAPCMHESLIRIHPMPDMLEDHLVKSYDEALRQACIRAPRTPRWESFEDRKVCACCETDFNWAYVLKSEPQRMLARFHCFACGKVVCDGCSQNRRAHQQLGLLMPVRTCDSCFFNPDKDC